MRKASTSTEGSRRSARVSRLPASRTCGVRGGHAGGGPLLCAVRATKSGSWVCCRAACVARVERGRMFAYCLRCKTAVKRLKC